MLVQKSVALYYDKLLPVTLYIGSAEKERKHLFYFGKKFYLS